MADDSKGKYIAVVAALITAAATIAVGMMSNWDKLFPEQPDVYTDATPEVVSTPSANVGTTNTQRSPTPAPTLTPFTPPPPGTPPSPTKEGRLEGVYEFVSQNFEPRPSELRMEILKVSDDTFRWESGGVYNGRRITSRGELSRVKGEWSGSIDYSDDPSILTRGKLPAEVSFDGDMLSVRNLRDNTTINWRRVSRAPGSETKKF